MLIPKFIDLLLLILMNPTMIPGEYNGCICPGFKRLVCLTDPQGYTHIYNNLCEARCRNRDSASDVYRCSKYSLWLNLTNEAWLHEVKNEAQVWKKSNKLIEELLDLSSGRDCDCPSGKRAVCRNHPAGVIEIYDSLCQVNCSLGSGDAFELTSCRRGEQGSQLLPLTEDQQLENWFDFMEAEIELYRKLFGKQ